MPRTGLETNIRPFNTEWEAADHYNFAHSSVRLAYICPTCKKSLTYFSVASQHVTVNRNDQRHIDAGVHVQVGTRHMVCHEPNKWFEAPQYRPPYPREARRLLNADQVVCREEFEAQCRTFNTTGIRPEPTLYD